MKFISYRQKKIWLKTQKRQNSMLENIEEIRVSDFINSLSGEIDKDIRELKEYAIEHDVPIIRDETKDFIRMILSMKKVENVLEIGTAIGYSTLVIHKLCKDAKIVTIEDYGERIKIAKSNIDKYFDKSKIELIENDAGIYLKENKEREIFDFVFLDAAKGQYINWLNDIKRLMKKDAILIADNIFKDGEILESKFLIKKRDRTIHKRMREFLHTITRDEELNTYIYSIGDGLSVSIKK